MIFRLILFTCCMLSVSLYAQDEHVKEYVLEAYPRWYGNNNYTIQGNIGINKTTDDISRVRYYLKPSFTYGLNKNWATHGGMGFYHSEYEVIEDSYELRPFLGLSHFSQFNDKWVMSSYFRAEERYIFSLPEKEKKETLRLRLRLQTAYHFTPSSQKNNWHRATLGIEGFKSYTNDTDIDIYSYETRVILGIERNLNEKNKIRFELAWKYLGNPTQVSGSDINTVYFKIQYYPIWGKLLSNILSQGEVNE